MSAQEVGKAFLQLTEPITTPCPRLPWQAPIAFTGDLLFHLATHAEAAFDCGHAIIDLMHTMSRLVMIINRAVTGCKWLLQVSTKR
eukprot:XP_001689785.1 predicted protein [Chlamydomonas reinhardtii]